MNNNRIKFSLIFLIRKIFDSTLGSFIKKYQRNILSSRAIIGDNVLFNKTSKIFLDEGSTFTDIVIDNNVMMYGNLYSQNKGKITIGEYSSIRKNSSVWCVKKVSIGKNVIISDNVIICDNNNHPISPAERLIMVHSGWSTKLWKWKNSISSPVAIGDNVWIGKDVKILKGVSIGINSIIGIGSVVVKDVPRNVVVAGNPAKVVKSI